MSSLFPNNLFFECKPFMESPLAKHLLNILSLSMNLYTLTISVIIFIATIGCQRKIHDGSIAQTKNDTSNNSKLKVDTVEKIKTTLKTEDFTLSIEPKRFTNSSMGKAKVIITNNTREKLLTGLTYYVDFYENNVWKGLNLHKNIIFELIGIEMNPFSAKELECNLKPIPHDYKQGSYRITKDLITADKKHLLISTQFSVLADTNKLAIPTVLYGSKTESLKDSVSMTISSKVFKLPDFNKATVTLTNKSSYNLTAGDYYLIEYFNGKSWEKITLKNVAFNDMAYGLNGSSSLKMDVYLKPVPHDYKKGKYRISKRLDARDIGQRTLVTAEFLIQ